MTQLNDHNLDDLLATAYRQQAGLYGRFLQLAANLPDELSTGKSTDAELAEMSQLMDLISQIDRDTAPMREQWKQTQRQPNSALAHALGEVEALIVQLMQQIDVAKDAAQDSKQRLAPKLSEESARRKMQAAYASAARPM